MGDGWRSELSLALFFIGSVFLLKLWWSRRRLRQLADGIPGAPTLPLLGNIHQVVGGSGQMFTYLRKLKAQNEGQPLRLWLGPMLYVFITTAEDIELLFLSERLLYREKYMTDTAKRLMGNGLSASGNGVSKMQKKIIAPSFGPKIIETYLAVFNKQADILVKRLKKFANGDKFDILHLVGLCPSDDSDKNVTGLNSKSTDNYVVSLLRVGYQRFVRPWLMLDTLYYLTATGREQKNYENDLHDVSDTVIHNRLQRNLENSSSSEDSERKTFLDLLVDFSAGDAALSSELKDEVRSVMGMGLDNTATTMSFTLIMLALHSKIQEAVFQELREVFSDDWERPVTPDDVEKLQRLDRAIKFFGDEGSDLGVPCVSQQFSVSAGPQDMTKSSFLSVAMPTEVVVLGSAWHLAHRRNISLSPLVRYKEMECVATCSVDQGGMECRSQGKERLIEQETMRLFPPVFHMFREVPQEVKLSTCTLPAGCVVSTMAYFVHRDPRYFPDPERFDPDRFLPEKSHGRHHYSYIPFGAGQRSCIGYEFAEMQMITTLATVLRKYRVLPAVTYESLQQLEISTVARPSCGYKLKMLPR